VSEVIDEGVTGMIVDSEDAAVAALPAVLALDRPTVRRGFDDRFTAARMAKDYVKVYRALRTSRPNHLEEQRGVPLPLDHIGGNGLKTHVE
jgi:hypothetical protein